MATGTPVSPYLSPEEIAGMTRPLTQAAAQMRYLRKIGIRAERRPDGSVLVMREWLVVRMPSEPKRRPELQPVIEKRRAQTTQTR